MLNPRHLSSLLAIAEHGSLTAAGLALGRSHSAISLHIKALEDDLGVVLLDRSVRPPMLTSDGEAMIEQARRLDRVLDDIRSIGRSDRLAGSLSIGVVPTAMTALVPPALARVRALHPDVSLSIRSGLSGELAQAVRSSDLDCAILTAPDLEPEGVILRTIVDEPLVVIGPGEAWGTTDEDLLQAHPFIWFSRKTWAGQQIERRLLDRGIRTRSGMEVDSLEAIEALVRHGMGVAIVPDRWGRHGANGLVVRPFGKPQATRRLALMIRERTPKARLLDALLNALVTGQGDADSPEPR